MQKTMLILAAHPDDEVLGCGGTIARYAAEGWHVHIVFFTDGVGARQSEVCSEESVIRRKAAQSAADILQVRSITFGAFPDNRMDSVDLLDIVQFVEQHIHQHQPNMILTHHANDLNIDHRLVHQATVTACRPQPGHCVQLLLFFEVPSSTEWQLPSTTTTFAPNWFVDISAYTKVRTQALNAYEAEMRAWPHSRSLLATEHLASWRGASVGVEAAEAFMLGRHLHLETT
ncbi:MAG: PIG-L family deacetylase [Gammaproteobacteria bacterium]|nr:PIG-L family deacetylase [Gammaproteobacteria bacterium]